MAYAQCQTHLKPQAAVCVSSRYCETCQANQKLAKLRNKLQQPFPVDEELGPYEQPPEDDKTTTYGPREFFMQLSSLISFRRAASALREDDLPPETPTKLASGAQPP